MRIIENACMCKHRGHDSLGEGRVVLLVWTRWAEVRPRGYTDVFSVSLGGWMDGFFHALGSVSGVILICCLLLKIRYSINWLNWK